MDNKSVQNNQGQINGGEPSRADMNTDCPKLFDQMPRCPRAGVMLSAMVGKYVGPLKGQNDVTSEVDRRKRTNEFWSTSPGSKGPANTGDMTLQTEKEQQRSEPEQDHG